MTDATVSPPSLSMLGAFFSSSVCPIPICAAHDTASTASDTVTFHVKHAVVVSTTCTPSARFAAFLSRFVSKHMTAAQCMIH